MPMPTSLLLIRLVPQVPALSGTLTVHTAILLPPPTASRGLPPGYKKAVAHQLMSGMVGQIILLLIHCAWNGASLHLWNNLQYTNHQNQHAEFLLLVDVEILRLNCKLIFLCAFGPFPQTRQTQLSNRPPVVKPQLLEINLEAPSRLTDRPLFYSRTRVARCRSPSPRFKHLWHTGTIMRFYVIEV